MPDQISLDKSGRTCTTCDKFKPSIEFSPDKRASDGLQSRCRECKRASEALARSTGDSIRRRNKAWRDANRDKIKAATAIWNAANKDKIKAMNRRSYLKNPLLWKVHKNKYRAQALGGGGDHTVSDIHAVWEKQGGLCAHSWCRVDLRVVGRHLDHRMPLVLGGTNNRDNLQYLCPPCNLKKCRMHPDEYAARHGVSV